MNSELLNQLSSDELEEYLKRSLTRNESMKSMLQDLQFKNINLIKKLNLLKDHAASLIQLIHTKNQVSITSAKKPILEKLSKVDEFSRRKSSNSQESPNKFIQNQKEDKLNKILADPISEQQISAMSSEKNEEEKIENIEIQQQKEKSEIKEEQERKQKSEQLEEQKEESPKIEEEEEKKDDQDNDQIKEEEKQSNNFAKEEDQEEVKLDELKLESESDHEIKQNDNESDEAKATE